MRRGAVGPTQMPAVARAIVVLGAVAAELGADVGVRILHRGVAAADGVLLAGLDGLRGRRGGNEGDERESGHKGLHGVLLKMKHYVIV